MGFQAWDPGNFMNFSLHESDWDILSAEIFHGGSLDPLNPLMIESAAKTLRFGKIFPGPKRFQTSVTIVNPIDVFRFSTYESI